jgi:hypothetical protein
MYIRDTNTPTTSFREQFQGFLGEFIFLTSEGHRLQRSLVWWLMKSLTTEDTALGLVYISKKMEHHYDQLTWIDLSLFNIN